MRVAGASAALAVAFALGASATAQAAKQFTSPAGSPTAPDCPKSAPCTIQHAIDVAATDDEVIVTAGLYTNQAVSIDKRLYVHGKFGNERPTIAGSASPLGTSIGGKGSRVEYLEVDLTTPTATALGVAVFAGVPSTFADIVIRATGPASGPGNVAAFQSVDDVKLRSSDITVNSGGADPDVHSVEAINGTLKMNTVIVTRDDGAAPVAVAASEDLLGDKGRLDARSLKITTAGAPPLLVQGRAGSSVLGLLIEKAPSALNAPGIHVTSDRFTLAMASVDSPTAGGAAAIAVDASAANAVLKLVHADGGLTGNNIGIRVDGDDAVLRQVRAAGTAAGLRLGADALVTDTVAQARGTDGSAVLGLGNLVLRNVTAVASGTDSFGVFAQSGAALDLKNVIARGTITDLAASGGTLKVSYSNWEVLWEDSVGLIQDKGHNQSGDPLFKDAANGNFHLKAGSPCIDAGVDTPQNGHRDFEFDPRVIGPAPDIGADER
jgi:hypothetical protein